METTILVLEILGTIAFTISGAIAAIDSDMDLLGILILGLTVAVGGGIIRDVTLDIVPPNAFTNPTYITVSLITTFVLLAGLLLWRKQFGLAKYINTKLLLKAINISDAIGLGAFTVIGVNVAIQAGHGDNLILTIFVGMLTGVGGGVLRDVFTQTKPYIFTKHIYGLASMIGATVYFFLYARIDHNIALIASAGLIVLIRYISAKYKLSLPRFHINGSQGERKH